MKIVVLILLLASTARADDLADAVGQSLPADLALVQVVSRPTLPAGAALAVEWRSAPHAGRMSILVTAGGRKGWARVELGRRVDVAVLRRALRAGERVAAQDVQTETRALPLGAPAPLPAASLSGALARRALAAGAIVATGDVNPAAPIPRGSRVTATVRRGAVIVKADAVLERAARPGERAAVRLASRQLVSGRLLDESTFLVEP